MKSSIQNKVVGWECDWAGTERHQIRYFKKLPLAIKIKMVEDMQETAEFFIAKAKNRRRIERSR